MRHALLVIGAQDRASVRVDGLRTPFGSAAHPGKAGTCDGEALRIALADGAGGTGRGAEAAQMVVDASSPWSLDDALTKLGGQSTAVLLTVNDNSVEGMSVGDSAAWLVANAQVLDLTRNQHRKPLLGDGGELVAFASPFPSDATLLVATDGLFRYAKQKDIIVAIAQGDSLEHIAARLVDLIRLPAGGLQDDVAIVLCRQT